jgi:hypothetical protein
MKLDGDQEPELYRMLLLAQCHALHRAMPFLFEPIDDETELLLPDNLLHSDSPIRKLVASIDEDDWQEVEIIGWLYQFYISEKKEQVIGKVVKSEDIPAATQLFTPNWIVKYLVQNSLGRQWMATYPDSPLKAQMEYYIEPAEQTAEVQEQLKAITPTELNPEELTLLDPACGSGHILVEAYDLLKAIYQERGYRAREIPRLILEKNLFGLEIDDRAAQLAAFALMMKARADDRRIFDAEVKLNVMAIQDSKGLDAEEVSRLLSDVGGDDATNDYEEETIAARELIELFEHGKTFGSLIQVPDGPSEKAYVWKKRLENIVSSCGLFEQAAAGGVLPLVRQATILARRYDVVVANPPYMGTKYYNKALKLLIVRQYKIAKGDLYSCFMVRGTKFLNAGGFLGLITIPTWMFLSTFEKLREWVFAHNCVYTFLDNGRGVFGSDFGSCSFVLRSVSLPDLRATYRRLTAKRGSVATNEDLADRFGQRDDCLVSINELRVVPGTPVAYLVSPSIRDAFKALAPNGFFGI